MKPCSRSVRYLCGAAFAALATAASAATPAAAPSDNTGAVSEVVVTGSRISQTAGYRAPTPLTVVSADQMKKAAPANIPQALNELPQFAGSIGPGTQSTTSTNIGNHGNALNLRALGAIRTLILLDGVRVPPSRYQGTVNVDILPELLVQRVEVVTGGASAVYGSDAVSGVVNYILDKDFTGVKAEAQGGISTHGDGNSYKVGAALGAPFAADRGHVLLSAEHAQNDPVWRLDRDPHHYMRDNWALAASNTAPGAPKAGTAANPLIAVPNVVNNSRSELGHIISGPAGVIDTQITNDGTVIPYDKGINTGVGAQIGGSGNTSGPHQQIITGLITDQLFGQASYDVTDNIHATANASYGRVSSHIEGSQGVFIGQPIFSGNAFLPAQIQRILTATNTASVNFSKGLDEMVPNIQSEVINSWTAGVSLSGDITDTWKFQTYYEHGESDFVGKILNSINNQHLYAALDAVRDPATGAAVCRVTLTNPGLYPGCVAFNPFGIAPESPAALAYITGESWFESKSGTDDVLANVSGQPVSTWAGPVGVSVGLEYRRATLNLASNSDPAIPTSIVGLRGAPATLGVFTVNNGTAHATQDVKEAFGELSIPLAKDWPLMKSLDLSLAGRRTDYSISGTVSTWKTGLSWRPIDDLRLRGTLSHDIRAPALYEIAASATNNLLTIFDPHVGTNFTPQILGGGNPNLKPEIGNTKSFGVVYQPSWLSGFSLSVDYYDIRIRGAIANSPPANILQACEDSGGTGATCALITRPNPFSDHSAANGVMIIRSVPINTAFLENRGVDIDASYAVPMDRLSAPGDLSLRAIVGYVSRYRTQADSLSPVVELAGWTDSATSAGGGAVPKVRGLLSANYSLGSLSFFTQARYIGRMKAGPAMFYNPDHIPAQTYFDETVTWRTKIEGRDTEFFLTVNNLFNKTWPLFPGTSAGSTVPTIVSLYDLQGRYFTVGARAKF